MKYLIAIVLAMFSFGAVNAQEMSTDFSAISTEAQASHKTIVLVFSGSDWCIPCMKLKKFILDTPAFQDAMQDGFLLINADFPQKKKNKELQSEALQTQNKSLAEQYNPNGYFPFVVVLDENQKVLGQLTYEDVSPEDYANKIKALVH